MATKVQIENCLRGQSSTRDISHESNGGSWPSCYTDGSLPKGRFHYSYLARTIADSHPGYDKDVVKQTMLEHEAIFKDQVYELHRLYRVQRGLMDEVRRKDPLTWSMPNEASSSSSPLPSHLQFDAAQRWNGSSYPQGSPCSGRPLISGTDIVQSSPNSMKGKSILAGPSPFQNCYSPKTSEASEFRPTKFRKRTLDLQLPADEYIDTDEIEQVGCSKDLHISKRKALADLNEPLHVEETSTFSAFGILGHSGSHSDASYRDLPAQLLSSSKDTPHNSKKLNGTSHNLPEIQANGQHWFRHALGSEQPKAFVRSIDQEVTPEKAPVVSRPVQILTSEHIKREPWKTNSTVLSQISDYHILGSHGSSQAGLSWNRSAWGKPNLPIPKPISIQPSLSHTSVHSNDFFGKRDQNSSPRPNAAFGSEPSVRNGYSQGSSAACTELRARFPKAGFDDLNFNYNENRAANNRHNSIKATTCNNINPVRDINLNDSLPNGVFTDKMEEEDCKPGDPLSVLPWLRGKGSIESKMSESCQKILGVSIFENPPKKKDALDISHRSRCEEVECSKGKHLFDMNLPCDDTSDSEVGKMVIDEVVVVENKETKSVSFRNNFDLNCCMAEEVGTGIDLEALISLEIENGILSEEHSQITESEKQPPEVLPGNSADDGDAESAASAIVAMSFCVKSTQLSMEERICLLPEAQGDDPLQWFVSIACCTENDGLDDFEYMILRLKECTPEEYFPKPSIPDFTIIENNSTCMLTSRTRKGPGRRGRQKRDFQRDILPGLTTLSRHEVTEDLQTFGGLMRATGYSWQSGPNRRNAARNGRGRGRRRSVETTLVLEETVCALPLKQPEVHCDLVEVSVVDRSLTGWGKTTRRPRRQRCPAGNHAIQVTLS
ncbi:uncharacterized protein LOC141644120 [Silene latifolia]|uniref:uncharacterized protein LOC141644120 n=1 Tax=Silene latifolia TaxID=37657 RepID=UPI003D78639F